MKKGDYILIGLFLVIAAIGGFSILLFQKDGASVTVTIDNTIYGVYDLSKDQEISIEAEGSGETNHLLIQGGKADMVVADCPDQICVYHNPIHKKGETIVCLPHKVVVEITENENSGDEDFDAVVK